MPQRRVLQPEGFGCSHRTRSLGWPGSPWRFCWQQSHKMHQDSILLLGFFVLVWFFLPMFSLRKKLNYNFPQHWVSPWSSGERGREEQRVTVVALGPKFPSLWPVQRPGMLRVRSKCAWHQHGITAPLLQTFVKILIPDPSPKDEKAPALGTETRKFRILASPNVWIAGIINITVGCKVGK